MASRPKVKKLEDVLPSPELLAHYKKRIEEFEKEREELLQAVERCAVHQEDVHRLEWENRKRVDEIHELQQALSDAQQFLFEERQRLLALQAENDGLKLQELEDRKRIQQLLSIAQPLEQDITFMAGARPSAAVRPGHQAAAAASGAPGTAAGGVRHTAAAAAAAAAPRPAGEAAGSGGERVLRTVFLPTVNADFLMLKVESLEAQLNEQRQLHEERVTSLLTDRKVRQQEEERHRANFAVQIEQLTAKVAKLEEALRRTTSSYVLARREKQEAEARAVAAEAQMVADVAAARAEAEAAARAAKHEVDKAQSSADGRMREYVDKFRDQVRAREEELRNLASLHATTKAASEERIAELEGRVGRLAEANKQLELRRQLDVDGWSADVTLLRKQLAAVDRKLLQMRLIDRLEDDERLDALLDQLQKRVPSVTDAVPGSKPKGQGGSRPGVGRRTGKGTAGRAIRQGQPAVGSQLDDTARRPGSSSSGSQGGGSGSVKSEVARELRAVRGQIQELEVRARQKAKTALR